MVGVEIPLPARNSKKTDYMVHCHVINIYSIIYTIHEKHVELKTCNSVMYFNNDFTKIHHIYCEQTKLYPVSLKSNIPSLDLMKGK